MIQKFINYIQSIRGYSPNTIRAYEFDLRQFATYITKRKDGARWGNIDRQDIDEYIIYLAKGGAMPATTNRVLSSISSFYNYCIREGLTKSNPCKYESRAKKAETIPDTIPPADIKKAYDNARGVVRTMIGLLATTGMRIGELLSLQWEDVNFEDNSIRIHGKGNKERVVYSTAQVLEPLAHVAGQMSCRGKMFFIKERKARYMIFLAMRPYTRVRKCNPHAIRHTYATELAKTGMNCATIAKILGHKSLETTQRYIDMAQVSSANNRTPNVLNITK